MLLKAIVLLNSLKHEFLILNLILIIFGEVAVMEWSFFILRIKPLNNPFTMYMYKIGLLQVESYVDLILIILKVLL